MAGIEVTASGEPWMVSRWIFRRLLEMAAATSPGDAELQEEVQVSVANELLSLDLVESPLRERVRRALVQASDDVIEGGDHRLEDLPADRRQVFLRATGRLRQLLTASRNGAADS